MRAAKVVTEIRQEQIAQAALELVAVHGVKGLTTERIATAVGVVPSALYKHFKNKKQIFKAIVQLLLHQSEEILRLASKGDGNFVKRIHDVYIAEITRAMNSPGVPFIVFSDEMLNSDSELKSIFCKIHERRLNLVSGLFKAAQEAGQIRKDLSPEALTTYQFAMVAQIGFLTLHKHSKSELLKHAELAWKVFEEVLKAN